LNHRTDKKVLALKHIGWRFNEF